LVVDLPSFTQNLMETHCSILPSIADKTNAKLNKHPCKNSVCSQCGVTWQTDARGLRKCDLGLPLIFFHWGSYNNNSLGTFRYHFVFMSPNDGVAQLYPRHRVPLSPPSTACSAMMEVF
jgi:ribosomal protein L40E